MSHPSSFVVGAGAASGRFRITEDLWDDPGCGRYRGQVESGEGAGRSVLVTTYDAGAPRDALERTTALAGDLIAPVWFTGTLDTPVPVGCLIEEEPAGRPLSALAGDCAPGALIDLYCQIAALAAAAHERGAALAGLRPELVYAEPHDGRLRLTGIAPRAVALLALLERRDAGSKLPFDELVEPFELLMRRPEPRSDVFVIAASLARLVGGASPFGQGGAQLFAIAEGRASPVGPASLWSVLAPALARTPADRPSAAELRSSLAALA